jgi:hypothetical protein
MCMSCNTKGLSKKRKIILFSSLGSGIAAASYLTFTVTSNPAISAMVPALLSLAACPAMCVGMGVMMWFMSRFSNKNKNKQVSAAHDQAKVQEEEIRDSCCGNEPEKKQNTYNIDQKSINSIENRLARSRSL